jgi:quinol monooxygenase YgiN
MNSRRVRLVLALDIREGKFSEFQKIVEQMVAGTEKEAGILTYVFLLSADRKHCRLIEAYEDVSAITVHFDGAAVV